MVNVFENLKLLKLDMKDKGWVIDSFYFRYKQQNYIVLVKLFEKRKSSRICSVKTRILKENDFSDMLAVYANSVKLYTDTKTIREYFGIEYSSNLGDVLFQFSQTLARFIPTEVSEKKMKTKRSHVFLIKSK